MVGLLALLAVVAGCEQVDEIREQFRAETAHEAYAYKLEQAGLATTALAHDWTAAASGAFERATPVTVPYRESGYMPPERPTALAYRIEVEGGQQVVAEFELDSPAGAAEDNGHADDPLVFMDLFRMGGDSATIPRHAESADSGTFRLEHAPWRGGTFVLRIQPELLRGGRYTVRIHNAATLAFPVEGRGMRAIQSVFGDPRDGGSRRHHGVDIFAPRGTPVIAAAPGRTRRVRETPIGGKVVWVRTEDGGSLYYAHLEEQLVGNGERVEVGDTLGLVGNSGNAITTPPHLHFGIYRRGPVDPHWFLSPTDTVPEPVRANTELVGRWARVAEDGARVRALPATRASVMAELADRTALRVLAATGDWYRVELPDGRQGHLYASLAEPADPPVAEHIATVASALRLQPSENGFVMDSIAPGSPLPVLGRYGDYLFVRAEGGTTGWLPEAMLAASEEAGAAAPGSRSDTEAESAAEAEAGG